MINASDSESGSEWVLWESDLGLRHDIEVVMVRREGHVS